MYGRLCHRPRIETTLATYKVNLPTHTPRRSSSPSSRATPGSPRPEPAPDLIRGSHPPCRPSSPGHLCEGHTCFQRLPSRSIPVTAEVLPESGHHTADEPVCCDIQVLRDICPGRLCGFLSQPLLYLLRHRFLLTRDFERDRHALRQPGHREARKLPFLYIRPRFCVGHLDADGPCSFRLLNKERIP